MKNLENNIRPLESWENRDAKGLGCCSKPILKDFSKKVEGYRQRQEEYDKSLPTDPIEAISAMNSLMKDMADCDGDLTAARSALVIVSELAGARLLTDEEALCDAVFWLSRKGEDAVNRIERQVNQACDIAQKQSKYYEPFKA